MKKQRINILSSILHLPSSILYFLFSILYFLSPGALTAQDENYDAVYLQVTKEYSLTADGSMDYHYIKKLKLQTYRAFNSLYGETFVVYNPAFQSLKINEVYTVMADGKKVSSPANAFNEVLPGFAANAPAYNNLREMVITHPGTERNAVLNLDYTLHSNKGFWPSLMGNELLAESEPVKELVIRVKVPTSGKLIFSLLNSKQTPVETTENGIHVYTWKFTDVPAISTEEFQKGGNDLYPRLIFSTAKDRNFVYSWFLKPAASSQQPAAIGNAVEKIKKDSKDEQELTLKLQEKVVNEFRLWPIPLRYTGFTCRGVAETWNSNGGTLAEKAGLLVEMLKLAGIPAEPLLVVKKVLFDEKIGSLLDIEDIIVKASPKESDVLYLSVSSLNQQNLIYGSPDKVFVSFTPNGKFTITDPGEFENKIEMKAFLTIDQKKQLTGEAGINFFNNSNPWFTLLRDNTKGKSFFGGFWAADLKELKVITTGPEKGYLKYTLAKEKPFHKDTNFYTYTLPYATNGIESWNIHLLPKLRNTPLEIPSVVEEKIVVSFDLPEGMTAFSFDAVFVKNKCGEFTFQVNKNGKSISVTKYINLIKKVVEPADYSDFKALMDQWNAEKNREMIFIEK